MDCVIIEFSTQGIYSPKRRIIELSLWDLTTYTQDLPRGWDSNIYIYIYSDFNHKSCLFSDFQYNDHRYPKRENRAHTPGWQVYTNTSLVDGEK